jgi:hypothetical protein
MFASQALYHLSHSSSLVFVLAVLEIGFYELFSQADFELQAS